MELTIELMTEEQLVNIALATHDKFNDIVCALMRCLYIIKIYNLIIGGNLI